MKEILSILVVSVLVLLFSCSEDQPTEPENSAPIIQSITASPQSIKVNNKTTLTCIATDADGDELNILWFANDGKFEGDFPNGASGASINWIAPDTHGEYEIVVQVSDIKEIVKKEIAIVVTVDNGIIGIVYQLNSSVVVSNALIEVGGNSTFSGEDGTYRIENIETGEVTVHARKVDYEDYQQTMNITSDSTIEHNISMIGSILFSGHIINKETNEPIDGAKVTVGNKFDYSDENGYYELTNVSPGIYNVRAKMENYLLFESSHNLLGTNSILDISMEYKYTNLSCIVKDKNSGKLLGNVKISIDIFEGTSDSVGYIEFFKIDKGTYTITADDEYYKYLLYSEQITLNSMDKDYEILLSTTCDLTTTVNYADKIYTTVSIGSQCWFKENLNVGSKIIGSQSQTNNGIIEKYCYGNDENYCDTYGGLYQWDELTNYSTALGLQGICPEGWHIPTKEEFEILVASVSGSRDALLAEGQLSSSTNISGFSALLAGRRSNSEGRFFALGSNTVFWSSTENNSTDAFAMYQDNLSNDIDLYEFSKYFGYSIRCLKD